MNAPYAFGRAVNVMLFGKYAHSSQIPFEGILAVEERMRFACALYEPSILRMTLSDIT